MICYDKYYPGAELKIFLELHHFLELNSNWLFCTISLQSTIDLLRL